MGNIKDFDFEMLDTDAELQLGKAAISRIANAARAERTDADKETRVRRVIAVLVGALGEVASDSEHAGMYLARAGELLIMVGSNLPAFDAAIAKFNQQPAPSAPTTAGVFLSVRGPMTRESLANMPECKCGRAGGCRNRVMGPSCHPELNFAVAHFDPISGQLVLMCPHCRSRETAVPVQVAGALPS